MPSGAGGGIPLHLGRELHAQAQDHIHIGQSWQGARKKTSAYTGYEVCDVRRAGGARAAGRVLAEALPDDEPLPT